VNGIDYDETFALVAKMDSIRLALSITTAKGWEVHQMDMKNAFIHGVLCDEIYMEHPQEFMQDSCLVCQLKKSLYGPMQAPRAWYAKMESYPLSQNFVHCKSDSNICMLRTVDLLILLVLYVDDLLIIGCSTSMIFAVKRIIHDKIFMTNMGLLHFFFGLKISLDALGIKLS
jgi:hypothetical protein